MVKSVAYKTVIPYNTYRMSPIQNVLIYNKQTAYEAHLRKGTDLKNGHYNLEKLQSAHNMHKRYLKKVHQTLIKNGVGQNNIRQISSREEGINVLKLRSALNITKTSRNAPKGQFKPDIVIAVGGDGTFLRASHLLHPKLLTAHLPIFGINSNPGFSEGRLCLKGHEHVEDTIEKILHSSKLPVLKRQRIKITMHSDNARNFQTSDYYQDLPIDATISMTGSSSLDSQKRKTMDLPIIALNDVFVGERASSMVSHLDVTYKEETSDKWSEHPPQKNSGVVVCTGTGSTGWSKSVNRICAETLKTIVERLGAETTGLDYNKFAAEINASRTVFDSESSRMGITFREPILNKISCGTFGNFQRVNEVRITSKLFHGMVSIDGSTYYSLPSGTTVNLSMNDAWAINCVSIPGELQQTY
jgi:NAD+ kinase